MARTTTPADSSFWKVDSGSGDDYWTAYETMRPSYADSSFLELIYDYHSSKSNPPAFSVAHDVGCGFGKATVEIAKRFEHVIASDSNESPLAAVQKRLSQSSYDLVYSQCTGEQLVDHYPSQSADFISVAEAIPLMDSPVALSGFARILRPRGTLAVWFYGRAHFSEPEYKAKC